MQTVTGISKVAAIQVYKNFKKGDPPFKPQKGTYGTVSWFKGQGNPYIGRKAEHSDIIVDVLLPDGKIKDMKEEQFLAHLVGYAKDKKIAESQLRHDKEAQRAVWASIGKTAEANPITRIHVPICQLNWSEAGTFYVINPEGRHLAQLADPAKFIRDLIHICPHEVAQMDEYVSELQRRKPMFKIVLGAIPETSWSKLQDQPGAILDSILAEALPPLRPDPPIDVVGAPLPEKVLSWADRMSVSTKVKTLRIELTLTYGDYLSARRAAKIWADLTRHTATAAQVGFLELNKHDATWKDSALKPYSKLS